MNKPFKYHKKDYGGLIIYMGDTDFKVYDYVPDFVLYKRGWFRDHEGEIVVKVRNIMHPNAREDFFYFRTQKEGLNFIAKYIKKLKHDKKI